MALSLELRIQPVLSVKAAIIRHLRWEVANIPSTVKEIAEAIDRSQSAVRRVIRAEVKNGGMLEAQGRRFMLAVDSRLWFDAKEKGEEA